MIRALLANLAAVVVLVAAFFIVLVYTVPSRSAEACRGQMVNASIYGKETCRYNPDPACPTAGGVRHFDGSQLLIAHRTLPMHSKVRLTFRGQSIVVHVLDRGPAKWTGKDVDLSKATAHAIGFDKVGSGRLCMERLP